MLPTTWREVKSLRSGNRSTRKRIGRNREAIEAPPFDKGRGWGGNVKSNWRQGRLFKPIISPPGRGLGRVGLKQERPDTIRVRHKIKKANPEKDWPKQRCHRSPSLCQREGMGRECREQLAAQPPLHANHLAPGRGLGRVGLKQERPDTIRVRHKIKKANPEKDWLEEAATYSPTR